MPNFSTQSDLAAADRSMPRILRPKHCLLRDGAMAMKLNQREQGHANG